MALIDYFAWLVLIVIVVSAVYVLVALAMLPGKIATKNNHPQVAAINVAGWLGLLLTAGVAWAVAMVWANMKPAGDLALAKQNEDLLAEVAKLEARLVAKGGAK